MSISTIQIIKQMSTTIVSLNPVSFTDIYTKNILKNPGYEFDYIQIKQ